MRQIEAKMVTYLDKALATNGLAKHAIEQKDARTLMGLAAEACVGIREQGGNNRGPMVQLLQETIGGASGEAWCMSFVQTCIAYAELKTGVKSPIPASEMCTTVWATAPKSQRVKIAPLPYAIVIWQHGKGPSGHTGFVKGADNVNFTSIEGNTNSGIDSKGLVERDGGGVYFNKRNLKGTGSMKVLGFLKPF